MPPDAAGHTPERFADLHAQLPKAPLQKLVQLLVLFEQVSFVERLAFFRALGPSNAPRARRSVAASRVPRSGLP